ncbi:MAG: tetratricopeptide repeat protein [Chromatiaceae bacterium]
MIENSRRGPVLVDVWAPWAGPSLRQGELLRWLADDYDSALRELAEIHRRDPGFRGEADRRGLRAIVEQLGPDDPRVGSCRRLLFQH